MEKNHEIYEKEFTIPEDPFLKTPQYIAYKKFLPYRFPFNPQPGIQPDSLLQWNPDSYQAYMIAGDYYKDHEAFAKAIPVYQLGLAKEIATVQERTHMRRNIHFCEEKIK